ncbi:tyrosyl-DNA phosphodiesterase 1-like isoform X2 [Portunus trituberculatus]|uniref:tyrosyl-DNA phosphodiesterase 1-like isoform X2 n=1 Tax=Portunus trituberculatus TaxID=210409 RepID=UPI001E1D18DE|nr:tyrosyl-DNA phosphodiesterase 1-like isoform X2 [Portunus trituberculatus]
MDADEEFARKLQREFDLEREWESKDASQVLATLQEKNGEEERRRGGGREGGRGGRGTTNTSPHSSGKEKRKGSGGGGGGGRGRGDDSGGPSQEEGAGGDVEAAPKPDRPRCQYGAQCYRKNPTHLRDFWHPHTGGGGGSGGGGGGGDGGGGASGDHGKGKKEGSNKREGEGEREERARKKHKGRAFTERLDGSSPYRVFLNKCFSVAGTHGDPLSLVFNDLLSPALGTLVETAQLTFLADLDFLMGTYKSVSSQVANLPLLLLYGRMEGDLSDCPNVTAVEVKTSIMYGTHHTKAMLLLYQTGLRVVIHTANLIPNDWFEKTQGYWVSPLFPKLESGSGGGGGGGEGEAPTGFKADLIHYLQVYKLQQLHHWVEVVKSHDFSQCRAVLVGSVPGYHKGGEMDRWGHRKVRAVLGRHLPPPTPQHHQGHPYTVIQSSSIGSLGKDERAWLTSQLHRSLTGPSTTTTTPKIFVVYPSLDDVKGSSEGWQGGSCLPYQSKVHDRQKWITRYLCVWRSEGRKRTRSIPHIKTYCRVSPDHKTAQYLLLTSANLSKAAWGEEQKGATQLFIRSYELGVLLLPKFITGGRVFDLTPTGSSPT